MNCKLFLSYIEKKLVSPPSLVHNSNMPLKVIRVSIVDPQRQQQSALNQCLDSAGPVLREDN
jgi:hypothetical protein